MATLKKTAADYPRLPIDPRRRRQFWCCVWLTLRELRALDAGQVPRRLARFATTTLRRYDF